jgi:hypothetical protein
MCEACGKWLLLRVKASRRRECAARNALRAEKGVSLE